jgi:uncharacterized peroxidase-related enzyme
MSRIEFPQTIEAAPEASRPLLAAVEKQLGVAPNLHRMVAVSPQSLEGYLGMNAALAKGKLSVATRNRIAIAIAEVNGCSYCLSAHTYLGKNLARLDQAEMMANRAGRSNDPTADAAVRFAQIVAGKRGHVSDADFDAVRAAGYDDAAIIEIVQHVALNTWTNYVNTVARTEIDFPVVATRAAARTREALR